MDTPNSQYCADCKASFPVAAMTCPHCGWQTDPATTWPPPVNHPEIVSPAIRRGWIVTGPATFGFAIGFAVTVLPTVFLVAFFVMGPFIGSRIRKPSARFTLGFLAGVIVGGIVNMPSIFAVAAKGL
jgi:hypothetical protein